MEFVNHTPFPALAFGGVDQHGQHFHVVVLRQTLTWDETGQLRFADEQTPLCEVDETFDGSLHGCVRQESDLCQYKPRCDVIVNADAHAPLDALGRPAATFQVRLLVKRPDRQPAPPKPPEGLNPWTPPSREALALWERQVEEARNTWIPGERLIDKTLRVTGERAFVKDRALRRGIDGTLTLATLGLHRPAAWRLTRPESQAVVPLRLDRAFGGQCRMEADAPNVSKVAQRHRLTPHQRANHPDADGKPPVAHEAYATNPAGRGFATGWFLEATNARRVPAPQIEHPHRQVTVEDFLACGGGKGVPGPDPVAGLGVRPKGHPERARLVGRVDRYFMMSDAPLPRDFDFAVWNAAWPDQQTEYLQGDEVIGLINLCAADTPGAWRDDQGNVLLRLALPSHAVQSLVRLATGEMFLHPAKLDTVIVEPSERRVALVWRSVFADLAGDPDAAIRMLEVWDLDAERRDSLERQQEAIGALLDQHARTESEQPDG